MTLNNGTFQPDGNVLLTTVAATDKWAQYVGASGIRKTDTQLGETAPLYSFTPVNLYPDSRHRSGKTTSLKVYHPAATNEN